MRELTPGELLEAAARSDELLSIAEASERLGVEPGTVRKWVHDERLAYRSVFGAQHVLLSQAVEVELVTRKSQLGRPRVSG